MGIENKRKGNTPNKFENNKRKSTGGASAPGTPIAQKKKSLSVATTPPPMSKKLVQKSPATPVSAPKPVATPSTKDNKKNKAAQSPKAANSQSPKGISSPLNKVSEGSKNIKKKNKPNKNKVHKGGQQVKGQQNQGQGQETGNKGKKNRYQRMQAKMNSKPRSPLSCQRALKAEQELNKSSGRVFFVRLADAELTMAAIKSWSPNIENALFPKPIEPRSFLLILKPNVNVKKELENLKKVTFAGSKISIEERKEQTNEMKDGDNAELIDPYTLYVTNLDESVTREDLRELFPKGVTFMNPRKHNPKTVKDGDNAKFSFVSFDSADEALEGFKYCFNKEFKNAKAVVARFRRVGRREVAAAAKEVAKEAKAKEVVAKGKLAKETVAKEPVAKETKKAVVKKEIVKMEEEAEVSGDEDGDSDDEDLEMAIGGGSDSEDDEDDGLEEEEDEDDDDDDDDDESD